MIDDATLERMLGLAALEVEGEARAALRRDLGRVLDSMTKLREAELGDLPPTYGVAEAARLRPDEPTEGLEREVALGAAPEATDELFVVPAVLSRGGDQ
ncbi:MAG: Asp-tRNA(Asn)/Glu-tRNA(Gln) amidotransferase GatCAB subunit C [Sandaracinus sp.]|nr:Asp-tRNA(Asn)/Glu-tRNA(Gln) amidotransferase GatCAB subunit C [Sandaracinus sp.]|tara:strand:+ start:593 stop:889 length:297 start_codon:yes stop_codon:yes gene_type:complete